MHIFATLVFDPCESIWFVDVDGGARGHATARVVEVHAVLGEEVEVQKSFGILGDFGRLWGFFESLRRLWKFFEVLKSLGDFWVFLGF